MADVTSVTGFKAYCATTLATKCYWATLHGTGGSVLSASTTTYATSGLGELATGYGYTAGGLYVGAATASSNNVDTPDAVWTASGGSIGPASYAALWVNASTSAITGAQLVSVKDMSGSPQTATDGNTMTGGLTNPISF